MSDQIFYRGGIALNKERQQIGTDPDTGAPIYDSAAKSIVPQYIMDNDSQKAINEVSPGVKDRGGYASHEFVYNSFSGVDISAVIILPGDVEPLVLGELQTISYSIHRENKPVRHLGKTNVAGFVKGSRTIAGSMIFTVFNTYAFYRLKRYRQSIANGIYTLADMLPPFDIVLSFQNEYGLFSSMKIYGVTIVDEGGTMSIDDLLVESTYTFMARGIQPISSYQPSGTYQYLVGREPTAVNLITFGS